MNAKQRGIRTAGFEALQRILEGALREEADVVEFEYVDEGLEVCRMFGSTGFGEVLTDRGLVREIIGALVEEAGLDKKPRGKMQIDLLGKPHTIVVEEYESFGESSFRLTLGEQGEGEIRQAKV